MEKELQDAIAACHMAAFGHIIACKKFKGS